MTVARTAARRRKQAVQGYTHLARLGRPIYGTLSKSKAEKRAAAQARKRQEMGQRKAHATAKKG